MADAGATPASPTKALKSYDSPDRLKSMKICRKCGQGFVTAVKIEGKYRSLSSRLYCLKCSPFKSHNTFQLDKMPNRKAWNETTFRDAVKTSFTITEVLNKIGLSPRGNNFSRVKKYAETHGVDTSHFKGRAIAFEMAKVKRKEEEIFCENSTVSKATLRKYLRLKKPVICVGCGISDTYNSKPIVLQVEHINGISNDNRLFNLEWRCPNCHSQTKTFCRRTPKAETWGGSALPALDAGIGPVQIRGL